MAAVGWKSSGDNGKKQAYNDGNKTDIEGNKLKTEKYYDNHERKKSNNTVKGELTAQSKGFIDK